MELHPNCYYEGLPYSLFNHFLVKEYEAKNIEDFLANKDDIKPTHSLLPPACFYNGKMIVNFYDVLMRKENEHNAVLSDTGPGFLVRVRKELPTSLTLRVKHAKILYNTKNQESLLIDYLARRRPLISYE